MALAEELLPAGGNILDYGKFSSSPVVLERSFAAGLLNDELHTGVASEKLVQSGSLELMKKIWQKHGELTSTGDWMQHWLQGMVTACKMGDLVVLQWMVEHTSGRAAIAHLKENNKLFPLLYHATFGNQLNVMQYLQERGAAADYGNSLLCAIRIDNMDAVTWLVGHFPSSEKIPEYCVLVEAARYGRVEMLEYFEELEVPGFPGSKESSIPVTDTKFSSEVLTSAANRCSCFTSRGRPTDAMDDAAANGKMGAVQWLHNNRPEGCTTKAMDEAAANGQLEVLKWLHANRSEGYTGSAILNGASKDHAETVKWLVTQALEIAEIAMTHAVVNGNLDLVKWLHTEAKARCTVAAMCCKPWPLGDTQVFVFAPTEGSVSQELWKFVRGSAGRRPCPSWALVFDSSSGPFSHVINLHRIRGVVVRALALSGAVHPALFGKNTSEDGVHDFQEGSTPWCHDVGHPTSDDPQVA